MRNIIGRFYFKIDEKGNLIGCFSNNLHLINFSEYAHRITGNGFEGQFNSTWTDDVGTFQATLTIQLKLISNDIYNLHWSNGAIQFWGEGFIVDNLLIGDYRNFDQIL